MRRMHAAAMAVCCRAGIDGRPDSRRPPHLSRPAAPDGAGGGDGTACCSSTTARRPMRIRPRRRWPLIPHIHWIVGGRAKTEDLGPCEAQLGHVRAAYTIGESGPMFFRLLEGKVPAVEQSGTLDKAVKDAAGAAKAGEVVLLSPACASFDQFRDYEHRGAGVPRGGGGSAHEHERGQGEQGGAARPLRHEPDRALVLGDRQAAADPGRGADLDRADRGDGGLAGGGGAAVGRGRAGAGALSFLPAIVLDRAGRAGDDRRLDAVQGRGAALVDRSARSSSWCCCSSCRSSASR